MHPQCVHVEVGHLHPQRWQRLPGCFLPRQQLRGQEMRAQDGVGFQPRDLRVQLARVELLDAPFELADPRVARWPVTLRVQVGPQLRELFDQLDVLIRIQLAELARNQRQQVDVRGLDPGRFCGRFNGLRRTHVAGAGRDTEDQQMSHGDAFYGPNTFAVSCAGTRHNANYKESKWLRLPGRNLLSGSFCWPAGCFSQFARPRTRATLRPPTVRRSTRFAARSVTRKTPATWQCSRDLPRMTWPSCRQRPGSSSAAR